MRYVPADLGDIDYCRYILDKRVLNKHFYDIISSPLGKSNLKTMELFIKTSSNPKKAFNISLRGFDHEIKRKRSEVISSFLIELADDEIQFEQHDKNDCKHISAKIIFHDNDWIQTIERVSSFDKEMEIVQTTGIYQNGELQHMEIEKTVNGFECDFSKEEKSYKQICLGKNDGVLLTYFSRPKEGSDHEQKCMRYEKCKPILFEDRNKKISADFPYKSSSITQLEFVNEKKKIKV